MNPLDEMTWEQRFYEAMFALLAAEMRYEDAERKLRHEDSERKLAVVGLSRDLRVAA